jgi:hypothetical protein
MRRLESVRTGLKNTSPGRRRFLCHLLGLLLLLPGRATFRNLSRYSVYHEKTFRRWCAQDFDWVSVNRAAIMQVIPAAHEHVLAFDPAWCLRVGRVSSHWREMRACNDNACGESKSQNSPEMHIPRMSATQSMGRLPPNPREACHPVHRKAATQST